MFKMSKKDRFDDSTFLPEDYVERKAERRTNVISVTLFVIVTMGVIAAFFVTNRQWNDVKHYQQAINVRYTQAAKDIEQLKILEQQSRDLEQKAQLTSALIEKVPRSIIMAELINRMPKNRIVLLELEFQSKRLDRPVVVRQAAQQKKTSKSKSKGKSRSLADKASEEAAPPEVRAPQFDTSLYILGVAPRHRDIAQYLNSLQSCEMLYDVELIFSEATKIKDREMNKFRIEAKLKRDIDARKITPLEVPRLETVAGMDEAPDPSVLGAIKKGLSSVTPSEEER